MSEIKRAAIVGTAPSWRQCPFDDPGLRIVSLNDAYMLKLPRADEWYELHPVDKFVYRKPTEKVVLAGSIPPGHYVRPEDHLEWLQTQAATIPVWLQSTPPNDWPANAQRLPIEMLQEHFGVYWASGPAYMLMHLYLRGYRSVDIYGIHLATEHEYREQRPNFEFLIGRLLGPDVSMTTVKGLRVFESPTMRIGLPVESPILSHGWKYAYEPKPDAPGQVYRDEIRAVRQRKGELTKQLLMRSDGDDPTKARSELEWLEVVEIDCQNMLAKMATVATPVVASV